MATTSIADDVAEFRSNPGKGTDRGDRLLDRIFKEADGIRKSEGAQTVLSFLQRCNDLLGSRPSEYGETPTSKEFFRVRDALRRSIKSFGQPLTIAK